MSEVGTKIETRGKPITCRYCKKSFKIIDKKQKQEWIDSNHICPFCRELWCILPPTERNLKYAQEQYLLTRSEDDMVNMLHIMYPYIQSLIKKNYAKALKFDGALTYYSNEVTVIMVEEYLSKDNFKLDISFGGFLIHKIRQAIYNPKQFLDQHISLDYEFEDGNNLHEMIADNRKDILQKIEQTEDEKTLHKKIIGLLEEVVNYCDEPYDDYVRTVSLYVYLQKGEDAFNKLFQAFGRKGKEIAIKTLDILKEELKKDIGISNIQITEKQITKTKIHTKNNMKLNIKELSGIYWDVPKKGENKSARNTIR